MPDGGECALDRVRRPDVLPVPGRESTLGYKGFARCDDEGFIDKVHVLPANAAESPEFETMAEARSASKTPAFTRAFRNRQCVVSSGTGA